MGICCSRSVCRDQALGETIEFEPFRKIFSDPMKLPVLDIGDRKGSTDYIDFIKAEDMNYPIMRGLDCFNRAFVAFKVNIALKPGVDDSFGTKVPGQIVGTFFRRYTDRSVWCFGTQYVDNILCHVTYIGESSYGIVEQRLWGLIQGVETFSYDKLYDLSRDEMIKGDGNFVLTLEATEYIQDPDLRIIT